MSAEAIEPSAVEPSAVVEPVAGATTRGRWPSPGRLAFGLAVLAASVVSQILFTIDPTGIGATIYAATASVFVVIAAVGPAVHGLRPMRVRIAQQASVLLMLVALLGAGLDFTLGPLKFVDFVYIAGYLGFLCWLTLAARAIGAAPQVGAYLDTTALTIGAGLALWVVVLSPLVGGAQLPQAILLSAYPMADILLLALTARLAMRQGRYLPAMAWFLASVGFLVALDICISLAVVFTPEGRIPALSGAYIFFFAGVAMSTSHPSVARLTRRPPGGPAHRRGSRRTALIVLTISPAILATVMPLNGPVDGVVRGGLVAIVLVLLFVRLSRTLSALSRAESASRHRAMHDGLTGLLNRSALIDRLVELLREGASTGRTTALLFIDCDDFKHINDTWGHRAGDTLLRDIATRLPLAPPPDAVVARHGGDEFVVLASVSDAAGGEALAARMRRFFDEPLEILPGRTHAMTCSIGLAVAEPGEAVTAESLIGQADVAMYAAKGHGRNRYVVYDDALDADARLRAAVGDRLAGAISAGHFHVELQPIFAGAAGGADGSVMGGVARASEDGRIWGGRAGFDRVVGWEALARWEDPVLGRVRPDVFVPVAEQLGLIDELGEAVLRSACADLARLRQHIAGCDWWVSVNVSPSQLLQPDFAEVVAHAVDAAGVPPDRLLLEATETLLVDKGPDVLATLERVRATGVGIGIDDFGTGYATLSTLLRLPLDCVKLDRSLVAPLGSASDGSVASDVSEASDASADPDADDATRQLAAVLALVRSLGIEHIVAEGVETAAQVDILRELDCPMAQGWFFGRPRTADAVLDAGWMTI